MNSLSSIKIGDQKRAYCVHCGGKRNCRVNGIANDGEEDQDASWWYTRNWFLLQCCGCDTNCVQAVSAHSGDYHTTDEGQDIQNYATSYWPAPSKRKVPDWFERTFIWIEGSKSSELDEALDELYRALDADLRMLAGIGVRTVFDIAAESLGVNSNRPFVRKLDDLVDGGHIGSVDRDRLSVLVDAGSASAHRGWKPTAEMLTTMMDILEHFLYRAFVEPHRRLQLDKKTAAMKDNFPKRDSQAKQLMPLFPSNNARVDDIPS